MDKNRSYASLKRFCQDLGIDLFGVAGIAEIKKESALSQDLLKKFDKAVSLGVRLSQGILEEIENAPTRLYFHHYRTVNNFLDQAAFKVSHHIQKKGFISIPIPASQIIDWQKQKAHLSHKKIAYLAGLGWIGRNNLLVNKTLGSQFRLVSILTDMPLKLDKPTQDNCQGCRMCMATCPAQAIKEDPFDFDHLKCFEKLKEFQRQRLTEQYICGICIKACHGENKTERSAHV